MMSCWGVIDDVMLGRDQKSLDWEAEPLLFGKLIIILQTLFPFSISPISNVNFGLQRRAALPSASSLNIPMMSCILNARMTEDPDIIPTK